MLTKFTKISPLKLIIIIIISIKPKLTWLAWRLKLSPKLSRLAWRLKLNPKLTRLAWRLKLITSKSTIKA